MQKFMQAQKKRIEIDKWCEGSRLQCDPGQIFVENWIKQYAAWFREAWQQSLCEKCYFVNECGFEVKQYCKNFKKKNPDI